MSGDGEPTRETDHFAFFRFFLFSWRLFRARQHRVQPLLATTTQLAMPTRSAARATDT